MSGAVGPGSVYQRKGDDRWVATVSLGVDHTGKRIRRTGYAKTEAEANRKLRSLLREADEGKATIRERPTVAEFCTMWAEDIAPQGVRDTTATQYRWILDRYVLPLIGSRRLLDLTPEHVAQMQTTLSDSGLAVNTVRQARRVLNIALNYAVRRGLLPSNPVAVVPQLRRSENDQRPNVNHLSRRETVELLEAASSSDLDGIITLAVCMGLRFGEVLALQWNDINDGENTVTIRRTLKEARIRSADGTYLVDLVAYPPKTFKSNRTLPVEGPVAAALGRQRARQARQRLAAGVAWCDDGWVFTTGDGGPQYPSNVRRRFKKLVKTAGLRSIRFHDLRHTFAVLALEAEVPLEQVSEALGHASIQITKDIYAAVVPVLADRAIAAVASYLYPAPDKERVAIGATAKDKAAPSFRTISSSRIGRAPHWGGDQG